LLQHWRGVCPSTPAAGKRDLSAVSRSAENGRNGARCPCHVLRRLVRRGGWVLLLAGWMVGCAARGPQERVPLSFPRDTLAITNETRWIYRKDPVTGGQVHVVRDPPPTYSLRCFVLSRTVKQFHAHAVFEPGAARLDEEGYRARIRSVVRRSPRGWSPPDKAVVIPGFDGLYAFSEAWPRLFQEECGKEWESYFQRGHWRMIFPFGRRGQEREAATLAAGVRDGRAPVVHLVDFPGLKVNHAVVLWDARKEGADWIFQMYDPNRPGVPVELRFDGTRRQFVLGPLPYFVGGNVDVYEVYRGWLR